MKKIAGIILILMIISGSFLFAEESDDFVFGGYIRYGINMNSSAEAIEGAGYYNVVNGYNGMRFMNEGNYSEWLFGYETSKDNDWWVGSYFRVAFDVPTFNNGWFAVTDFVLPEALITFGYSDSGISFWGGRKYNTKIAIDMMDYYVANLDANGVGIDNIPVGAGSLNMNWLFSYDDSVSGTGSVSYAAKQTLALDFSDYDLGPGSMSFIIAPSYQGKNGVVGEYEDAFWGGFAAVKYDLPDFFSLDGNNQLFTSFGYGSGANQHADMSGEGRDISSDWSILAGYQGSGTLSDSISLKNTLYYEGRSWQPGGEGNFLSFGIRPMIKQSDIFGWQFEYDLEAALDTSKMVNRFTVAPTFVPQGGDVNAPVQIQAYVTYAYGDFQGADNVSLSNGSKHGMTYGVYGSYGF